MCKLLWLVVLWLLVSQHWKCLFSFAHFRKRLTRCRKLFLGWLLYALVVTYKNNVFLTSCVFLSQTASLPWLALFRAFWVVLGKNADIDSALSNCFWSFSWKSWLLTYVRASFIYLQKFSWTYTLEVENLALFSVKSCFSSQSFKKHFYWG